jgi:hypothetical protein
MSTLSASLIAGLLMAVLHWFPWSHRLHRVSAYAAGLGGIMAVFTALALLYRWYDALIALWCIVATAGGATIICYAYDSWRAYRNRARIAEQERDAADAD